MPSHVDYLIADLQRLQRIQAELTETIQEALQEEDVSTPDMGLTIGDRVHIKFIGGFKPTIGIVQKIHQEEGNHIITVAGAAVGWFYTWIRTLVGPLRRWQL